MIRKKIKKILRILIWIVAIFIFLLILFLIFTQTPPFRSIVSGIITDQVSEYINGDFTIDRIGGNFFTNLALYDIVISVDDEVVISLKELSLRYNLLQLLLKRIVVKEIIVNDLYLLLSEEESGWNLERLFVFPEEEETSDQPQEKFNLQDFKWQIDINDISFSNINVEIRTTGDEEIPLPSSVDDLYLQSSFILHQDLIKFALNDAGMSIRWEDQYTLSINKISFIASLVNEMITLEDFLFDSDNFVLTSFLETDLDFQEVKAELDFLVDNTRDFAFFFDFIRPEKTLWLTIDMTGSREYLDLDFRLQEDEGYLDMKVLMTNPMFFEDETIPVYSINATFNEFTPSYWLKDESLYLLLNGNIVLSGDGFDLYSDHFDVKLDLSNTVIRADEIIDESLVIDKLESRTKLQRNRLDVDLEMIVRDIGSVNSEIIIGDLEQLRSVSLEGEINELDLVTLHILNNPSSNLNVRFRVNSESMEEEPVFVELEMLPSSYENIDIESLILKGVYHDGDISVDTLAFSIEDNTMHFQGTLSEHSESQGTFSLSLNNIEPLLLYLEMDYEVIEINGQLQGNIAGSLDDLRIEGEIVLNDTRYDDFFVESFTSTFIIDLIEGLFNAALEADIRNFMIDEEQQVESVDFTAEISPGMVSLTLDAVQSDLLSLSIASDINMNDVILISINDLKVNVADNLWELKDYQATIQISDKTYIIDNFQLHLGEQIFSIDGTLSLENTNDLSLSLENLDIEPYLAMLDNVPDFEGMIDLGLTLRGQPESPEIRGFVNVSDVTLQEMSDISSNFTFQYDPSLEVVAGDLNLFHDVDHYASVNYKFPVKLSLADGFEFHEDREFDLTVLINDLDLSILEEFVVDFRDLGGLLRVDLHLSNTLGDLRAAGSLGLIEARFSVPVLGTSYRNINLDISLEEDRLDIDRFVLRSGQGRFNGEGFVYLGMEPASQNRTGVDPNTMNLQFNLEELPLINTSALDINANGRLFIQGTLADPRIRGNILLNRGRINLDKLIDALDDFGEEPLLVKARDFRFDPMGGMPLETEEDKGFDIDRLRGEITLSFPRNVWIRSSDMNLELSADLTILVEGDDIQLYGVVNTIRGFYIFFGKRFQIVRGEFIFAGGTEINPQLSIEAVYSFRGQDMTRNNLKLLVSGTLEQMEYAFQLNDQAIDEADAISYILLGRSFDELTQSEKNEVGDQFLAIGGFLISGQLASVIGDSFSLDMIEFRSDSITSQIGIELGKYITDRLYVSYKRDFSYSDTGEPVSEEILVEFELTPFLFLQLVRVDAKDTGVDVIWRYKWR